MSIDTDTPDQSTGTDDRSTRELLRRVAETDSRSAKWAQRMLDNLDEQEGRTDA